MFGRVGFSEANITEYKQVKVAGTDGEMYMSKRTSVTRDDPDVDYTQIVMIYTLFTVDDRLYELEMWTTDALKEQSLSIYNRMLGSLEIVKTSTDTFMRIRSTSPTVHTPVPEAILAQIDRCMAAKAQDSASETPCR
jgi:hypothetical protein